MKIRLMNNLFTGFFILLLIPFSYVGANGLEDHPSLILKKEIPVGNEAKIDSDIRQKIENKTSDLSRWSVPSENNEIGVYIYLHSKSDKIPENIPIFSRAENIIYSKLSPHQIRALADLPNVKRIGSPIRASIYDNSVSEGVNFSFANQMHSLGYTGSNVTVAVIDSGFFPLNPEISSNVESTSFGPTCGNITCGDSDGHSHGTAVSEVVVDMAPDVRLRLYAGLDLIDTLNALDSAISSHVKIITMSIGFPSLGGDGTTGYFRDGTSLIAKKVNDARNGGILVTVASGNSGQSSWSGTYLASEVSPSTIGLQDYQSLMNFRPSFSGIQQACLPVTDNGDGYYVSWNDWDLSDQDYDLYAFDSSFTTFYGQSIGSQTGFEPPIEGFVPHNPAGGVCLVLASWSSSQNHFFHLDALGNSIDPSVLVKAGSLSTPSDAAGALTVGAIDQATDNLEPFSSQGPTDDSRKKPEICGPDNTFTHQADLNPFRGTSASTPHVAGAAALLLQQDPTLSVDQLRTKLISDARFNSGYSLDNECGFSSGTRSGALSLQTAATSLKVIKKIVNDNGGTLTLGGVTLKIDSTTVTNNTSKSISPGIHTVSETAIPGYFTTISGDCASDGSITLSVGESKTCFITNDDSGCLPPISGDWTVSSSCTLPTSAVSHGNVIVQNGAVLTIPNGLSLDIDFKTKHLLVKSGSGVLIKAGGKIF